MEDGEFATLNLGGELISREALKLEIFQDTSDSSQYAHSMLGEIMEQ